MCIMVSYLILNLIDSKRERFLIMPQSQNRTQEFQDHIRTAIDEKFMLNIVGGNTKHFYGNNHSTHDNTQTLETRIHTGITSYTPSELVITARAGTPLSEIEYLLNENNQMLPFEPPSFGEHATIGGVVASGLSGSRRPFTGSVRDFVLGVRIINGKGEILSFGGQVMKNVAGYDVSRLMTGAMGTLGLLLEVSIKVLPKPQSETTQVIATEKSDALKMMRKLIQTPLPISAMTYQGENLYIRLSGANSSVNAAEKDINGEPLVHADKFWKQLNEQSHSFFQQDKSLWRLSVPFTADISINQEHLVDWAGALYWFHSDEEVSSIHELAKKMNGHATLFKSKCKRERFMPIDGKLKHLQVNLKTQFDPYGILNFGRLYKDL